MKKIALLIILAIQASVFHSSAQSIDLSGEWSFAIDPDDVGVREKWYNKSLTGKIRLPGSLQEQGYGEDIDTETKWTGAIIDSSWFKSPAYSAYRRKGNIKIPFWLQPDKHYVGVAWYQREIYIPESWEGKHVEFELERTHWETTLYVNSKEVGKSNALHAPHRYVIDRTGKLLLTVRVDNRVHIPVGINAHSISDHTQTNWNGIVGDIRLSARSAFRIDDVRVYPDIENRKATVKIAFAGKSTVKNANLTLCIKNNKNSRTIESASAISTDKDTVILNIDIGDDMLTWSEYEPNLYTLNVNLRSSEGTDTRQLIFGMREIKACGTRIHINGIPVFLRGTLECAIFPLTGYPPTDTAYWQKIYRRCKEYGLNHVRFHSWCPPEVAFDVADREGIYLQVECGGWAWVGDGKPQDQWFYDESERIVKEYGNHPSFCMMLYGNEPHGSNHTEYLSGFVRYWKAKDRRRLYAGGAGWPYIPEADYWNTPEPRIQQWGAGLNSIINFQPPRTDYDFQKIIQPKPMPTVSHEIGQWCVYPDFREIPEYTGVLKAKNFEIFRETLAAHHLGDLAGKFLYASGRLQTLCYKADIEAALRTSGFGGFQLLDLHDFPGQGTALVGVLNPFWNAKDYVDDREYRMFCNRTVPLARMHKLIWTDRETFKATLEVSHFDRQPLRQATVEWEIADKSKTILASGQTVRDLPINNCIPVAEIAFDLSSVTKPAQLTLTVRIASADAVNRWNFWVYPETDRETAGRQPYFTTDCQDAIEHAGNGENVLYCIPQGALKADRGGDIKVGFSSIFWNTAWTRKQAPHTLGIYCDPEHPVFAAFPNEGHSDYQWWEIVTGSSAMVMDRFPPEFRPLVHIIDDWFTNRKLGLLFETKVGKGKMIVCSADLSGNPDERRAALRFRRSIEEYMASGRFNPAMEIDAAIIKDMLNPPTETGNPPTEKGNSPIER
ncbi:MAG: beta-galactosidase [Bacteroidales bacterium]|nr:beta-galactosidase [Bacteroidales bacterium]